jgi:branched-chain amino acid transport system permease protein
VRLFRRGLAAIRGGDRAAAQVAQSGGSLINTAAVGSASAGMVTEPAVSATVANAGGSGGAGASHDHVRPAAPASTALAERPSSSSNGAGLGTTVVEVRGLSKAFGGIHAVQDLEMTIEKGRITGLIGPNGAGKTTIFNLLTGTVRPDRGKVFLRGEDITGRSLNRIANMGMVRSFQDVRVYANLTPLENVLLAVRGSDEAETRAALVAQGPKRDRHRRRRIALEYLDFVGLGQKAAEVTGSLPFGEQKLVSLARVLAAEPDVLLLDEPASGIDKMWIERIVELVARLRALGLAICLVEHNLEVIRAVADRVYFLESGTVTAEGTMEELSRDQRLIEAYFGATA